MGPPALPGLDNPFVKEIFPNMGLNLEFFFATADYCKGAVVENFLQDLAGISCDSFTQGKGMEEIQEMGTHRDEKSSNCLIQTLKARTTFLC